MNRVLRLVFGLVVLGVIAFGFYLTGSPSENRVLRRDEQRVQDLNRLQSAVVHWHRREGEPPTSLDPIFDACTNRSDWKCTNLRGMERDAFELKTVDADTFELCTTFERPASPLTRGTKPRMGTPAAHGAGFECFAYTLPKPRGTGSSSSAEN